MGHRIQRVPLAAEVVLYAAQDQRAAKKLLAFLETWQPKTRQEPRKEMLP